MTTGKNRYWSGRTVTERWICEGPGSSEKEPDRKNTFPDWFTAAVNSPVEVGTVAVDGVS